MSTEFASTGLTTDQLNAIVKKLGGRDMALCFLRDEYGVTRFSVTSNGMTGEKWIAWFESKDRYVGDDIKQLLRSPDFKPSKSGKVIEVAVLKGILFGSKAHRNAKNIRVYAEAFRTSDERRLSKPSAELACLIHKTFTNREIGAMDLRNIVVMHEPINNSDGVPCLLSARRDYSGHWLGMYRDGSDDRWWSLDDGFAFAVSQVSSQS